MSFKIILTHFFKNCYKMIMILKDFTEDFFGSEFISLGPYNNAETIIIANSGEHAEANVSQLIFRSEEIKCMVSRNRSHQVHFYFFGKARFAILIICNDVAEKVFKLIIKK